MMILNYGSGSGHKRGCGVAGSRLLAPDFLLVTPGCYLLTFRFFLPPLRHPAGIRWQVAGRMWGVGRAAASSSKLSHCAYCLLPWFSAFRLMPTAYCLLSSLRPGGPEDFSPRREPWE